MSRGGVVDSQAVADAVTQGKLLGYGADVFEHEPIKDNDPLLTPKTTKSDFYPHAWAASAPSLTYGTYCVKVQEFTQLSHKENKRK